MSGSPSTAPARTGGPPTVLVLAAGASQRWGGRPKALLDIDGEPALLRVLRLARAVGCGEAVVVVGPHPSEIRAVLSGHEATVVPNPEWARGRTGSLQRGIDAAGTDRDVLVWPIDHPFAEANTLRRLGDAARGDPIAVWVIPTYEGKGGHPIWMKPAALRFVGELAADAPLRSLHARLGAQVLRLPTSDPWVLVGTDTAEEYSAAIHRRRRGA